MAIPGINVLGNPNVTEGNFQVAIEDLRKSVIGSGKAYDSANTYSQYDTCIYGGIEYYSKINSNTGNTPTIGANWGNVIDLINPIITNGAAFGYGTGSGGIVTQATSKTTNVTLNKPCGKVIMNNSTMAANSIASFTINNTAINYGDTIILSIIGGVSLVSNYRLSVFTREDSMDISITNQGSTSLSEAVEIMYTIVRGAIV